MARGPKAETKKVTLDIASKRGAKELVKLREQGWEVVSEHKRGTFEWKPGQVDYVLTRPKGGPEPTQVPVAPAGPVMAPPAVPAGWHPDPQVPGLLRYWDGARWTEHTHPAG